jgi:hypothetical protein
MAVFAGVAAHEVEIVRAALDARPFVAAYVLEVLDDDGKSDEVDHIIERCARAPRRHGPSLSASLSASLSLSLSLARSLSLALALSLSLCTLLPLFDSL